MVQGPPVGVPPGVDGLLFRRQSLAGLGQLLAAFLLRRRVDGRGFVQQGRQLFHRRVGGGQGAAALVPGRLRRLMLLGQTIQFRPDLLPGGPGRRAVLIWKLAPQLFRLPGHLVPAALQRRRRLPSLGQCPVQVLQCRFPVGNGLVQRRLPPQLGCDGFQSRLRLLPGRCHGGPFRLQTRLHLVRRAVAQQVSGLLLQTAGQLIPAARQGALLHAGRLRLPAQCLLTVSQPVQVLLHALDVPGQLPPLLPPDFQAGQGRFQVIQGRRVLPAALGQLVPGPVQVRGFHMGRHGRKQLPLPFLQRRGRPARCQTALVGLTGCRLRRRPGRAQFRFRGHRLRPQRRGRMVERPADGTGRSLRQRLGQNPRLAVEKRPLFPLVVPFRRLRRRPGLPVCLLQFRHGSGLPDALVQPGRQIGQRQLLFPQPVPPVAQLLLLRFQAFPGGVGHPGVGQRLFQRPALLCQLGLMRLLGRNRFLARL